MLWRNPKAHVLAEHEARLRIESGNRTKDNHGDGNENPLECHDDVEEARLPFRTFRNQGEGDDGRYDEAEHSEDEQIANHDGKIVREHSFMKDTTPQKYRRPPQDDEHDGVCDE